MPVLILGGAPDVPMKAKRELIADALVWDVTNHSGRRAVHPSSVIPSDLEGT